MTYCLGMSLWITQSLGSAFEVELIDHGLGRISMLAVRGTATLLFNSHLDTVPVIAGSRFPALELTREQDRVYGRGACDIKGAAAGRTAHKELDN